MYFIRKRRKREKNNRLPGYEMVRKKAFACVGQRLQAFNYYLDKMKIY
jgi:hypothetical protein